MRFLADIKAERLSLIKASAKKVFEGKTQGRLPEKLIEVIISVDVSDETFQPEELSKDEREFCGIV